MHSQCEPLRHAQTGGLLSLSSQCRRTYTTKFPPAVCRELAVSGEIDIDTKPFAPGPAPTFSCSDGALGSTKDELAPPISTDTQDSVTVAVASAVIAVTVATGALRCSPTIPIPEAPARGNCPRLELGGGAEGAGNCGCLVVLYSRSCSKPTPL